MAGGKNKTSLKARMLAKKKGPVSRGKGKPSPSFLKKSKAMSKKKRK